MADNKNIKEVHGIEIDSNGHKHAIDHLTKHMDEEQLKEMVHNARMSSDRNSHFTARVDRHDVVYKLSHHSDGTFKIDRVHHHS